MRRIIIPAAAGFALIANAGLAVAQGREGGPERQTPGQHSPGGQQHAPGVGQIQAPSPGAGPRNREMNGPALRPDRQGPRAENRPEREQRRSAEQERSRGDRQRAEQRNTERQRNAEQEQSRERGHAAERAAQEQRQRKSAEQPAARPDRQTAERNERDSGTTKRYVEFQQARTRLNIEQRQRLHSGFDLQRARLTHARFDYHVGHRVPRDVRLYPVSREVISFFPYYRDYSYFVVGDEICIVDPRTYVVVDVIDEGYRIGPRPEIARLSLSPSQIALVRDSIPADFPEAGVRIRLALGAEIPQDVELYEFPVIVLDRTPDLHNYRFLVAPDQIVVVDPRDRSIALFIDRT